MSAKSSAGRDLTQTAVLALLGRAGPMSRADVARELEISPPTVTAVVRRLVDQAMVQELDEEAPSRGGRRGQLIGLVGTAARAIGVKVAADHVAIVEARLDGSVHAAHTLEFDALAPEAAGRLASALRPFVEEQLEIPLLGLGIGVPGVVDSPDNGRVHAPTLGWSDVPLGRHLHGALGLPVLVENDVKALTVAEQLFGRGRRHRDFLVLTIGSGVGLGIVTGGTVYRGSHGGAGEFGHFPVDPHGTPCACGNRGCLEAIVGSAGLVRAGLAAGVLREGQGVERLQELADRGDHAAAAVYAQTAAVLARAVAALVTVLDPEVVIVLGEGAAAWQHWDRAFREGLIGAIPSPMDETPIEVEPWDDTAWAQGAAAIVLATPFDLSVPAGRQKQQVLARFHGQPIG
ncbi:ROK family transcriptional regulator [Actinospica sp.]|uniref:ROK family transcriptional regulator n=1 Tax=Actinospica sp. TaxID=1872142 RepID=UPI002C11FBC7|nr:ROK family transcriptional regulator [Actinospica sp.]HWG27530.1 ROK family transcriptional regulator [Actinospica sp.]